jgi:ABC-type antimicrobial peptide transport system permease subunit
VKAYDLIELAGRNLREAGLRNSLTTLGIGVGVASLVAMLSLGIGLQMLANRNLGRSGLFDTIVVTAHQEGGRSQRFGQPTSVSAQSKPLDDEARHSFEQIPNVLEVYANYVAVADLRLENAKGDGHFTVVGTLPQSARSSESFDDVQGGFFSAPDAQEVVILTDFARDLLGLPAEPRNSDVKLTSDQANQLLGKYLIMRYHQREGASPGASTTKETSAKKSEDAPETAQSSDASGEETQSFNLVPKQVRLKIVGIVNSEPNRGFRQGRIPVFMPLGLAESLNMVQAGELWSTLRPSATKSYVALMVRVKKSKAVAQVEDVIKKQGFSTFSIVDASKNITRFFRFLDLFLGIFGSMALAVASLGIVNTLVMAILERRREIGILKALGASDGDVKRIFFVEAGAMGLLGGMLGAALGWMIGRVINIGTNIWLVRQELRPENFWYVPWWLVAAALGFSVFVSLFAGLYPAGRAARLDPVHALRHD